MCKVGDEHPSRRVADASEEGYGEHEPPAFAQGTSQRVGAQHPHAGPQGQHEEVVLDAAWNPLAPEPKCFGSSAESSSSLAQWTPDISHARDPNHKSPNPEILKPLSILSGLKSSGYNRV